MTLAVADMAVPTTSSVNERKKSTARASRCSMDIIQQLRTKNGVISKEAWLRLDEIRKLLSFKT